MLSSGQVPQTATPAAQAGAGPMFVPFTPLPMVGGSSPSISVSAKLDGKQLMPYMWAQMGASAVQNTITAGLNYALASQSMKAQRDISLAYYGTQDKIASYQKEVAIAGLGVQDHAISAQQSMHSAQMRHEERMAQLEGATQARIAGIQQDGMTSRAKIMSTTQEAFVNRRTWSMGTPYA